MMATALAGQRSGTVVEPTAGDAAPIDAATRGTLAAVRAHVDARELAAAARLLAGARGPEAHARLDEVAGEVALRLARPAAAVAALEVAVAKAPGSASAWRRLGIAHFELQEHGEARAAFERAVELGADDALLHGTLGIVLAETGAAAAAAQALERAMRRDPRSSTWPFARARVLVQLGRIEEARALERRLQARVGAAGAAERTAAEPPRLTLAADGSMLCDGEPLPADGRARWLQAHAGTRLELAPAADVENDRLARVVAECLDAEPGELWLVVGEDDAALAQAAVDAPALDAPPLPVRRPAPATDAGPALVHVLVDARGAVRRAGVFAPFTGASDAAALLAVRGWRFAPATRDGVPVPFRAVVRVGSRERR